MFKTVCGTWKALKNVNYFYIIEGEIEYFFSSYPRVSGIIKFALFHYYYLLFHLGASSTCHSLSTPNLIPDCSTLSSAVP